MRKVADRIEPFLDELDKQVEKYKQGENDVKKSGIYG